MINHSRIGRLAASPRKVALLVREFFGCVDFRWGHAKIHERGQALTEFHSASQGAYLPFHGLVRFALLVGAVISQGNGSMEKLDNYLTIKNAAAFLGVSQNTVRNWGRAGKIPMHRNPVNGYRLFKQSDLEQLLNEAEKSRTVPRKAR
ncbi:MerR family transcriptional regulator [Rhodopirellula europaea]|nr:helix-turn-helix domain-containing protein [Rhodopirellula europaea]